VPPSPSRQAILDAAESLFARTGYAAASIKQIAAAAGVNSALLYYYFADKDALYRAVLERVAQTLNAEGRARIGAAASPEESLRAILRAQARALALRPHLSRLLLRELLEHEDGVDPRFLEILSGGIEAMAHVIESGQRSGRFRSDVAPRPAAVSAIAQGVYFAIMRPLHPFILRDAGGHQLGGADGFVTADNIESALALFAEHAGEFAIAALTTQPRA
jgi:TetR/AcrR family transcriptional regulator